MNIIFFGTPDYVIPVLNKLHREFKSKTGESPVVAVVTQKPKPVGRKKQLEYSAVDQWAYKKGIKILRDLDIGEFPKAELGILASYGEIIPDPVIGHFKFGILNVHPSLLPEWRGSSPVQASIISGVDETGVSIIKLDEKLDHGPIISQFKEGIQSDDTTETLRKRLFERSAEVLVTLIPAYLEGKITPRPQDHTKATYTRELRKADGFVPPKYLNSAFQGKSRKEKWEISFMKNFTNHYSPITIHQYIRAMQPWPGAWTYVHLTKEPKNKRTEELNTKRLKIFRAHVEPIQAVGSKLPATKLVSNAQCLVPDLVQLEGKSPVNWKQFQQGYPRLQFV